MRQHQVSAANFVSASVSSRSWFCVSCDVAFCGSVKSLRRLLSQRHLRWQRLVAVTVGLDCYICCGSVKPQWRPFVSAAESCLGDGIGLGYHVSFSSILSRRGPSVERHLGRQRLVTVTVLVSVGTSYASALSRQRPLCWRAFGNNVSSL